MAAVRGLTGLLAALLLAAVAFAVPRPVAACTALVAPSDDADAGPTVSCAATVLAVPNAPVLGQDLPDTATAPPGADDPNRVHIDPGVWPLLVFIVAMFVFGLVIRGSRSRREPRDPPDRRRR
jgi:hypothetical protein